MSQVLNERSHELFAHRAVEFPAPGLERTSELLAILKAMEVFVDAMTSHRIGNIDQSSSFGIVNFKPGTLGKLIKAVVGGTQEIEPPFSALW